MKLGDVTDPRTIKRFQTLEHDFNAVHDNKYCYSLTEYINAKTKVNIICEKHGPFMQTPNDHLNGTGCPGCGSINSVKDRNEQAAKDFIPNSIAKHGPKYDYSEVEYINCNTKVKIICKTHGPFLQTPKQHLNGHGCPKCGSINSVKARKEQAKKDFIPNSIDKHGPKYDYSEVEYINTKTKVKIICSIHGPFMQIPNSHLLGNGCSSCKSDKSAWDYVKLYETNTELGSEPGIFYILKFKHTSGLEFLKAGITSRTIKKRYDSYADFTYEVLEEQHMTNLESALKEKEFMNNYKEHKFYFPDDIKFSGRTECFNIDLLKLL